MRKTILLVLLSLVAIVNAQEQTLTVSDFSKGLLDKYSSNVIPDGYTPDCQNVLFDEDLGVVSRKGYLPNITTAFTGNQSVRSGKEYIKLDGATYWVASSSSAVWYSMGDGTKNILRQGLNANYDFSFVTPLNFLYASNGYDTPFYWNGVSVSTSSIPNGKILCWWKSMLFSANVSGAENTVYFSNQTLNQNTIESTAGSNSITVNPFGNDRITGIYPFGDYLIVTQRYSTWKIAGTTNSNLKLYCVDSNIGCLYGQTICYQLGTLKWLSSAGIVQYDGNSITKISTPIDNTVDNMVQLLPNQSGWLQTSAADWNSGTCTTVDTTTASGDIILAKKPLRPDTGFYTTYGNLDYCNAQSFITPDDSGVKLSTAGFLFTTLTSSANPHFLMLFSNNNGIPGILLANSNSKLPTSNVWNYFYFNPEISLSPATTYWIALSSSNNIGITQGIQLKNSSFYSDGYYAWSASGNGGWSEESGYDTYFYIASMSYCSNGTFTSPVSASGSSMYSWSTYDTAETLNGQNLYHYIRASTNSFIASSSTPTWTRIYGGSIVSGSTGTYIQTQTIFSSSSATAFYKSPSLSSIKVNWNMGSQFQPPTGITYKNRYWLSYTSTNTYNTDILVYDTRGALTKFKGLNAYAMFIFRNKLLFGDSSSTGYLYQFDTGYGDNGAPINAYCKTKDYDLGSMDSQKVLNNLTVTADYKSTGILTQSYTVDKSTVQSLGSINLDETNGIINHKSNFPNTANKGKTISFKFSQNSSTIDFKLYSFKLYFDILPVQ